MQNSSHCLSEVFFAMCKGLDTPRSLAAWLLYESGEWAQLVDLKCHPENYCSSYAFHADYVISEYLSKYKGFDFVDTTAEAIRRFNASEKLCLANNERIRRSIPLPSGADSLILGIQRKINRLLGDFHYGKVMSGCRWGPGATASLPARDATLDQKILERGLSVTLHALPFFKVHISDDIHWLRARGIAADGPCCLFDTEFNLVGGGRLSVVPKSAKTGRTILVEPTGNLFLQFGVGTFIRRRLLTVGVDLDHQDRNRYLAREGYATIDLKSASDTVYRELVFQLLPPDWAEYLDRIRSKSYTTDGKNYTRLEKFSSMGNGFTFELESLIFWAIAHEVMKRDQISGCLSVFGDDVVVPSEAGDAVVTALEAFGFEVNRDKTFTKGPFRESCGGHYWNHHDVTPIYQKEVPHDHEEIIRLFNRIIRLSLRSGLPGYRDSRFRNAARAALRYAGPSLEAQPDSREGSDDGFLVFVEDPDWLRKATSRRFVQPPSKRPASHEALLAFTLRFRSRSFGNETISDVREWVYSLPFDGRVSVRQGGAYASRRRPFPGYMSSAPWS